MRPIKSLDELNMPEKQKAFLANLLEYFKTYQKIERVLLFGSCARGSATSNSDIDLFIIGSELTDDDEWEIVWNCPKWSDIDYVPFDLISGTHSSYEDMSRIPGMLQHAIELRGVDLSELL